MADLTHDNELIIQTKNPSAARNPPRSAIRMRVELILLSLLMAATAALYLWWAGTPSLVWSTKDPAGYDSMQADALLAGQLFLKAQPHPALLQLTDPYNPQHYGPYHLIDLSFYRGRYYLYFGVAPVLTLFLPWQAITGTCLTDEAGAVIFTIAGFILSVMLLRSVRRRYFMEAPTWAVLLAAVVLALGNLSLLLLRYPNYPQIPIASAWTWQIAALTAVFAALHSRRALTWLALASGACGLAVASRPTFLLGALLLIPVTLRLASRPPSEVASGTTVLRVLMAVMLPIGAIGALLMIYNKLRFDSPFEFGMHYQLAGGDPQHQVLLSPRFFPSNALAYLFSTPVFTRYFPFIQDQLRPLGVLTVFPFSWLVLLVPIGVGAVARDTRLVLRTFVLSVVLACAGNFVLLAHYYLAWPRFQLDFFLVLSWLAALGLISVAHAWAHHRRRIRLLGVAAALLAGVNICLGFCFAARTYHAPQKLAPFARLVMHPVGWLEKASHVQFGPMHLEVEFPANPTGQLEPLLYTGTTVGDLVYVRYLNPTRIQFGLFHAGLGFLDGEPVTLTPGVRHSLDLDLGSLCPPPEHPQFAGWNEEEIIRVRTRLTITLDGHTMLARDFMAHPATPADLRIGTRPADLNVGEPGFTGWITIIRRGPLARTPPWFGQSESGGAVLTLRLGPRRTGYSEPLLCSGRTSNGDVLFITYLDHGYIRFGVDSWSRGTIVTDPIPVPDGSASHRLAVWMPPLARPSSTGGTSAPPPPQRLTLVWEDRLLWDGPCEFHAASPESVFFGINPIGASSAEPIFAGQFISIRPTDPELRSGREDVLPNSPVSLLLLFPRHAIGRSEPLVVTGRPGAGDFVYVRYDDQGRVRFGFDHWGVSGTLSDPIEIDSAAAHRIEVMMGSLYPDAASTDQPPLPRERRVVVTMDGRTVLTADRLCHPSLPRELYIGENPIGGSTCGERFTGRLLLVQRAADR